jgi:hypothetical protein
MDRKIVWPGQVPLETDLLGTNRNAMIAIGRLAQDILGSGTLVSGLAAAPTSPASMSVSIGAGAIYQLQPVDGTAYSSLPANTTDYVTKQGINTTSDATLLTFTAPTTSGQSVIFLIQAAYSEVDTDNVVLPFYNASNPAVPYSGPSNTGVASSTTGRATSTWQSRLACRRAAQRRPLPIPVSSRSTMSRSPMGRPRSPRQTLPSPRARLSSPRRWHRLRLRPSVWHRRRNRSRAPALPKP